MAEKRPLCLYDGEIKELDAADDLPLPLGSGVTTANSPAAGEFAKFTDPDTIEGRTVAETKADLELDAVENTADIDKPLSLPQQSAITAATDAVAAFAIQRVNHTGTQSADTLTDGTTNKAFLATERTKLAGIATGATANSPDATLLDRSNHTGSQAQGTITNLVADLGNKADLVGGLVPSGQLPSFVDDVLEAANFAALPGTGATEKIYVTIDDNKTYRWSGSAYVEISASLALGETISTAYRGDRGKTAYDHSQEIGNPHGTVPDDLGLGALAVLNRVNTDEIETDAVAYAKMQNVSAISKLLGRGSAAGAGDVEEITLGTNLSMAGTTLNATGGGADIALSLMAPAVDETITAGYSAYVSDFYEVADTKFLEAGIGAVFEVG